MEWNGIRSKKMIFNHLQDMIRTSRPVGVAICRHVVNISIDLGLIGSTNDGEKDQKDVGKESRPSVQKVSPEEKGTQTGGVRRNESHMRGYGRVIVIFSDGVVVCAG